MSSNRPAVTDDTHPITDALLYMEMIILEGRSEVDFGRWSKGELAELKRACLRYDSEVPGIVDVYDGMLSLRRGVFQYEPERIQEWTEWWQSFVNKHGGSK